MRKTALLLTLALAGVIASGVASAHGRGRVHFGFYLGGPVWPAYYPHYYPAYYPAPYYYPPVVVQSSPPVYVERPVEPDAAPAAPAAQGGYWYYCETARGYYPYVKSCPSGWQAVPPAPAPAR